MQELQPEHFEFHEAGEAGPTEWETPLRESAWHESCVSRSGLDPAPLTAGAEGCAGVVSRDRMCWL
jgi:hypothetical protein